MISAIPLRQAPAEHHTATATVALDFAGTFSEGSYAGAAFSGRITYDPAVPPSERHLSFAMYDRWPAPIVTIAVEGHILTADGAAVYDSIFDGTGGHYDFVTMHGTGPFGQPEDSAYFELFFADSDASTLDGTQMPSADRLRAFPARQLTLGTDAPGNVISVGTLTVSQAG
jgi:hypothetical protein